MHARLALVGLRSSNVAGMGSWLAVVSLGKPLSQFSETEENKHKPDYGS